MAMKFPAAKRGERTIYVEHGVWYDWKTKHVHVSVPGSDGAHLSYGKSDKKCPLYRGMLEEAGRWPEDVE